MVEKIKRSLHKLLQIRPKKIHLDYIAGILSIPVLIMAIAINFGNLTKQTVTSSTPNPSPQVIIVPQSPGSSSAPTSTTCTPRVGPITISSPEEGETITDNPVCITISYNNPNYCSVVWSYRINGGAWSDFNNTSPCLYNLPSGTVTVNLRVNSTVSSDQTTLTRTFIYNGSATPNPTQSATTSAH